MAWKFQKLTNNNMIQPTETLHLMMITPKFGTGGDLEIYPDGQSELT